MKEWRLLKIDLQLSFRHTTRESPKIEPEMNSPPTNLNFLWWNLQDFAHYDPKKAKQGKRNRFPKSKKAYNTKLSRVVEVIRKLNDKHPLSLIGFAEVTRESLTAIRDTVFPSYRIYSLVDMPHPDEFQIGVLYDPSLPFENEDYLTAELVLEKTRPVNTLEYVHKNHRIRFYFCHWTAQFDDHSDKWRSLSAQAVDSSAWEFVQPQTPIGEIRHVVVLGDLNEEPFGEVLEKWLYASRDRQRAISPTHYTDVAIQRLRLYNCSWRMLGEISPHPISESERAFAGTYYRRENKSWHTFDQVIMSGSLLSVMPPHLDEHAFRIGCRDDEIPQEFLDVDGLPAKFDWNDGEPIGLSDHFPILGRICLEEDSK